MLLPSHIHVHNCNSCWGSKSPRNNKFVKGTSIPTCLYSTHLHSNPSPPSLPLQLKGYASKLTRQRELIDSSDVQGYAVRWNDEDLERRVFKYSTIILTSMVTILDVFIFLLAIGMTTYSYDRVYQSVKGKQNPGYPLFWSTAVLCWCWDVAPSWLVLAYYNNQVKVSLIVLPLLLFGIAVLFKKKSDFPVPWFQPCKNHDEEYYYSFNLKVLKCCRCLASHLGQVVAIWGILVFFAFLIYYVPAVVIAFYLFPTTTLIKLVFLKAVVICAVLTVALIFSLGRFKFPLSYRHLKHNAKTTIAVLTVLFFLPILAYLAFVVSGILFVQQTVTGLQGIITLIPSLFLALVAWLSRHKLFPKGLHDPNDPGEEIVSDLEDGDKRAQNHVSTLSTHHQAATALNPSAAHHGDVATPTDRPTPGHSTAATLHSRSVSGSPRFEPMSNYRSIGSHESSGPPFVVVTRECEEEDPKKPLLPV